MELRNFQNGTLHPKVPCPGCRELYPNVDGPTHTYIGASAGCWQLYGEILAREFNNARYFDVHRLTVDAYAAQHPGEYCRRSAQSVNVHLVGLYLVIKKKLHSEFVTKIIGKLVKQHDRKFDWLSPPKFLGKITIKDVYLAENAEEHAKLALLWGESVLESWSQHHNIIQELANNTLNT